MFEDISLEYVKKEGVSHSVRRNHIGMTCHICRKAPSGHKVEQDVDEAIGFTTIENKLIGIPVHPLTAYVCCKCFRYIMGDFVQCGREDNE